MRKHILILLLLCFSLVASGQQYTGLSGLVHIPTADMSPSESMRVGVSYMSRHSIPSYAGIVMDTPIYHVAFTPYKWIEGSLMMSGWRRDGLSMADRSISVKVRPLEEGKWWPSVALGTMDPFGTGVYSNYYVSLSKHVEMLGGLWGATASYRYYKNDVLKKWQGVVGGVTFSPNFYRDLRASIEYTGNEFCISLDAKLFRFLKLQAALYDWRWFCGGVSFEITRL